MADYSDYMTYKIQDVMEPGEGETVGEIEVCASVGEIDGILLGVTVPGTYSGLVLDIAQAHRLMLALKEAINILAEAEDARVDLPELTRLLGLEAHEQEAVFAWTGETDPDHQWTGTEAAKLRHAWVADSARIEADKD